MVGNNNNISTRRLIDTTTATTTVLAIGTAILSYFSLRQLRKKRNDGSAVTIITNAPAQYDDNDDDDAVDTTSALTPTTIRLLLATSDIVGSKETADKFYNRLFLHAPELKELFVGGKTTTTTSMGIGDQALKFSQMMQWTTRALQQMHLQQKQKQQPSRSSGGGGGGDACSNGTAPTRRSTSAVVRSMTNLGRRHVRYGVQLKHFHPVKQALLDTIAELDFPTTLSDLMTVSGSQVHTTTTTTTTTTTNNNNNDTKDVLVEAKDIVRAWEALLYAFVGCMGPVLLLEQNESLVEYGMALENSLAAPAGGTATAMSASQGVALLLMAIRLDKPKQKNKPEKNKQQQQQQQQQLLQLRELLEPKLTRAKLALQSLAGRDMAAYCRVMVAVRQPLLFNVTDDNHRVLRKQAIADSLDTAADIPLRVVQWSVHALQAAISIVPVAAKSGIGDAGAGVYLLVAAAKTGLQNIRINAPPSSRGKHQQNDPRQQQREAQAETLASTLEWQQKELARLLP